MEKFGANSNIAADGEKLWGKIPDFGAGGIGFISKLIFFFFWHESLMEFWGRAGQGDGNEEKEREIKESRAGDKGGDRNWGQEKPGEGKMSPKHEIINKSRGPGDGNKRGVKKGPGDKEKWEEKMEKSWSRRRTRG